MGPHWRLRACHGGGDGYRSAAQEQSLEAVPGQHTKAYHRKRIIRAKEHGSYYIICIGFGL